MIKGLTAVRSVTDGAVWERLGSLFASLGFEAGKGWSDEGGKGSAWLAPVGNLELVTGRLPAVPELLVECTALDAVRSAVVQWSETARQQASESTGGVLVGEAVATHWGSRMFELTVNEPVRAQVSESVVHPSLEDDPAQAAFADAHAVLPQALRIGFWEREGLPAGDGAVEGDLSAAGMRFGIVVARWNAVITDRLLQGAVDAIVRSGGARKEIEVVRVPGAWEVPAAARLMAEQGRFNAIVTLGCLLRGETAHYEAIYNEAARGIGQSQQETGVPHGFGVLTCETLEQALNRAGVKAGNKGFEAAMAAIEMASLKKKLGGSAAGAVGTAGPSAALRSVEGGKGSVAVANGEAAGLADAIVDEAGA